MTRTLSHGRTPVAAAVFAVIHAAGMAQAHAQDAAAQEMPKIIVGADAEPPPYRVERSASPRYTQQLRDTPQTIIVIPQAVIREQAATTLRDVLRDSPGITFQAGEGGGGLPGDQNFTLRGFSARNSLYVDGVRDVGSYTRDAFNLQQVEVAKGPTATLAGRSSTAGAINQVSKAPQLESLRDLDLALGTEDYRRVAIDINEPFTESTTARLNAVYHESGVAGRDVVAIERWGVAPSVAFGLGNATQFSLAYLYQKEDNVPDYGLPWGSYTQDGVVFPTGAYAAPVPVDQSIFYGLEDYDFEDVETQIATGRFEHNFSETTRLSSVLRFIDTDRDSAITAPRPPNRNLQRRMMGVENLTNQTTLTFAFGTGHLAHAVATGVELSRERTNNRNSGQATNQPPVPAFFAPDPSQAPLAPMPANSGNPSETQVDTVGVYFVDTVALGDRWQVIGGARWDRIDVDYELRNLTSGAVTALASDDNLVSWHAGLVYKPRENGSVYVAAGTSFDPSVDAGATGAALADTPTAVNNPNLDPEETRGYEIGTKWDVLDERLSLTAAAFVIEKTNARTRTTSNDPFVLDGSQEVEGIELGAAGQLTARWSAFAGYAWMDTRIESTANTVELDQALLYAPENSFNFWTTYALPFGLMVGGGAQFMDDIVRARNATTGAELELPSYWLWNVMASYGVSARVTLQLNVLNVTDEDYVDRVGGGHYIPGPTRTALLSASFKF